MNTSSRLTKIAALFILLIIFFDKNLSFAQTSNIGTPPITNYSKQIYNAGTQNWDIAQSKDGVMYFANNGGLLEFDGVHWLCYGASNQTIIRSVAIDEAGRIFVGAQGEMGYFSYNEKGTLIYKLLTQYLQKEEKNFGDVWDTEILGDQVYFRTNDRVYCYDGKETIKLIHKGNLSYLTSIENEIYLHDTEKGILKLKNGTFQPFINDSKVINQEIVGIFKLEKRFLISTRKSGLYIWTDNELSRWETNDNNELQKSNLFCSTQINKETFAFGTTTKGVFILNKKGQVLRQINQKNGLQKNNIISLFADASENLWLGLDNGIDHIATNSPFTRIFPDEGLEGTGYAIAIHDDKIYFGTSTGVYTNEWKPYYNPITDASFRLVNNTKGQVYNFVESRDKLLLNHHEGVFDIQNGAVKRINGTEGAWLQIKLKDNEDLLLSGHYNGLKLLSWQDGWQKSIDFQEDWNESARIMVQDEAGNVWVSHPYRGVFKINFNEDYSKLKNVKLYNAQNGFPSDLQIYVFKIGVEAIFATEKGIYSYNEKKDQFEPNKDWNEVLGEETWVRRLIEAPDGNVWFVTEREVGMIELKDGGLYKKVTKHVYPQLNRNLVGGFETIYAYDDENVFVALESGFLHFNPEKLQIDSSFNVLIRAVELKNNPDFLFKGQQPKDFKPTIGYRDNSLSFTFAATYFDNIPETQYQFYLEGFENDWLNWTEKTEKEYTNLNPGTYTFKVRAKNFNGVISKVTSFTFTISPPWYQTKLAFSIYFLMIGGILFSLVFFPKKRFEREKAELQSEQEKTLQRKELEHQIVEKAQQEQISKLEREKLETEINFKNQELASTTMHLVKKSEMLQKIQDELRKIKSETTDPNTAKSIRKVVRLMAADQELSNDWKQFEQYFDQVHSNFLKRLREQYPQLTPKDYRLCAYLRMNLSTKEIAPLMNISVRGVEIARYRLRKKLALESNVNLVEMMMKV